MVSDHVPKQHAGVYRTKTLYEMHVFTSYGSITKQCVTKSETGGIDK